MKKYLFSLLLCFLIVSSTFTYVHAEGNAVSIIESPDVKIVIEGKAKTYQDVTLIIDNRTFLPLRAILTDLGVQNDDGHIIWNSTERSITVIKDSIKIYLKIDSSTAYVNDSPVTLDAAPVIYPGNNRTYIPVRFIAQSLGRKVVWDGDSKSVLIRDPAEFDKMKATIDKINAAENEVNKCMSKLGMRVGALENGLHTTIGINTLFENDRVNKKIYISGKADLMNLLLNAEIYYAEGTHYEKDYLDEKWEKKTLSPEEYEREYSKYDLSSIIMGSDKLYAGFTENESANPGELLLRGNVYLDFPIEELTKQGNIASLVLNNCYSEISVDKSTYLVKGIKIIADGKLQTPDGKSDINIELDLSYDYSTEFQIVVPEDVVKNAAENPAL